MSEKTTAPGPGRNPRPEKSAWKSPALLIAVLVTLLGVGMWVYASQTRPSAPPTPSSSSGGAAPDGMVSGFSTSDPMAAGAASPPAAEPRLIDRASPAVARFGACFVAGFCIAYAFKKFIKVAAIVAGVVFIGMFVMAKAGIIDFDWSMMEGPMHRSVAWLRGEAGAMKDFILGYLPSAGSAAAGMLAGFRRG